MVVNPTLLGFFLIVYYLPPLRLKVISASRSTCPFRMSTLGMNEVYIYCYATYRRTQQKQVANNERENKMTTLCTNNTGSTVSRHRCPSAAVVKVLRG